MRVHRSQQADEERAVPVLPAAIDGACERVVVVVVGGRGVCKWVSMKLTLTSSSLC